MPFAKRRNKDGTYNVVNTDTGKVHASHTSEQKAAAQLRLLYMVMNRERGRSKGLLDGIKA